MPPKLLESFTVLDLVTSLELTHVKNKVKITDDLGNFVRAETQACYHHLYGSTIYGTSFGVYGQFECKEIEVDGTPACEVIELTMRILNYQGVLNMGFAAEAPPVFTQIDENGFIDRSIEFGVQGASGKADTSLKFKEGELVVKKGERVRLTFERLLVPLEGFNALPNYDERLDPPKQTDKLFDSEFHYRNGVDHYPQYLRDGLKKPDVPANQGGSPAKRCLTSTVNLLYW